MHDEPTHRERRVGAPAPRRLAGGPGGRSPGARERADARDPPGDGLGGEADATPAGPPCAVTVQEARFLAPPARVWPWLLQLGAGRGGWYAWDGWDNGGVRGARSLRPELQGLRIGDRLSARRGGGWFEVTGLEPERLLVLTSATRGHRPLRWELRTRWSFALRAEGGCVLRVTLAAWWSPRWALGAPARLGFLPLHRAMQRRQLATLRGLVDD